MADTITTIALDDASRRVLLYVIEDQSATLGEDLSGDYGLPGLRGRLEAARDQLVPLDAVDGGSLSAEQARNFVPLVEAYRAECVRMSDFYGAAEDVADQLQHVADCDTFLQRVEEAGA
jgi:hypothetical protein